MTIGIVGGLGTETSCSFCFSINRRMKSRHKIQPHLIMDNIPISDDEFHKIANGEQSESVLELLKDSVKRLNRINSNLIAIPCNTVHVFIDQLRRISKVPILSIIEETSKKCIQKSFRKVAVLGSTTTIKTELYPKELQKHSVEVVKINEREQKTVTDIIIRIINSESSDQDKNNLLKVIKSLKERGAEAIILGCTDLFLLIKPEDSVLPVIDSTKVLEEAVISKLNFDC
ncbi:MAG TPA: amino acid racemase [Candidatus Nanoarchaeia archaeon]|nr:amino acid racemase [Candidatus Nanoarchaeia archaeon]